MTEEPKLKVITFIIAILIVTASPVTFAEKPEILKYRGVQYVSGGMNELERTQMDNLASRFPMHLVLTSAVEEGPISGVLVLEQESRGPLFFVEVVGGRYTVQATYNGQTLTETKDLTGRRYLRLRFKFTQ